MRFLLDEMLSRLGRWLCAAGYDAEIVAKGVSDDHILEWAKRDHRILISRDKHFLEKDTEGIILIYLESNQLIDCVQELTRKLPINWTYKPFSRCTLCNSQLIKVEKEGAVQVPPDVLETCTQLWKCQQCQKFYWEGSHTERMLSTLRQWESRYRA